MQPVYDGIENSLDERDRYSLSCQLRRGKNKLLPMVLKNLTSSRARSQEQRSRAASSSNVAWFWATEGTSRFLKEQEQIIEIYKIVMF